MTKAEKLELIYHAAVEARDSHTKLCGLLESIMWLAGDLNSGQGFEDKDIHILMTDKEAFRASGSSV